MKEKFKLFCFGFGQVAKYFIKNLMKNNFDFELVATNTKMSDLKDFNGLKYKSYYFSDNKFDEKLLDDLNFSNKILVSIPPINNTDIVLKTFDKVFKKNKFDWVSYLSATSVYGNKNGAWVDENTNLEPTSNKGKARLNAENNWLEYHKNFNLPIQIFRLSGIYSLEKNVIKRLQMKKVKIIEKKNQFFSRIHVEDVAQVLTLSLSKFSSGQVFNISDNYPCSNEEVVKYISNLMKIKIPKKIKLDDIEDNLLKNFYKDSKKVSNKKMKFFFNYELKFPTFKEGLNNIKDNII